MTATLIPSISYTARDYETILNELNKFIRETRADAQSDFFDSTLGQLLIQMMAYVGDILSYSQDVAAQEFFLATCRRYESAIRFANSVGYVPRSATAAVVTVKSSTFPPQLVSNGGTVPKGSTIKGASGLSYELVEDVIILPGDTVARLVLREGTSYREQFEFTNKQNQEVTTSNAVVEDVSWEVFVGDALIPSNKWTQVDNVQFQNGPTNTYDIQLDGTGRARFRFGDGTAGKIPDQVITSNYRTTNGTVGNAPAGSIRGSLKVNLSLPGVGTVAVLFENRDVVSTTEAGTLLHTAENQGTTIANVTQGGIVASVPVVSGSLTITVQLTAGIDAGRIMVLQDDGAGSFQVITNTTLRTLLSSIITYSTGAWSILLSSAFSAAGTMVATYYSIVSNADSQTSVLGAASGGDDRESLPELRVNIPAYIRSQDKIITLEDYNTVIKRVPGITLVFTDILVASYSSNMVKIHVWATEETAFKTESTDGSFALTPYTRYATVQQDRVNTIQDFIRARTMVGLHNLILRPQMLWVDVYLGNVIYDKAVSAANVQASIAAAIVAVFQDGTGFEIRLSSIYDAVRESLGVKYFTLQRIATGIQATSTELQGQTTGSATIAGTLLYPVATPKSVRITAEQSTNSSIVIIDSGNGNFTLESGAATILSSTIDYRTGAWSCTFVAVLVPNQRVLASYANVTKDYRHDQLVTLNGTVDSDYWPPPGTITVSPVSTPPYRDGYPITVPPYTSGMTLIYDKIQDIVIQTVASSGHFYDETYLYNNEIYYNSVSSITTDIRAINLRRLVFDLVAQ